MQETTTRLWACVVCGHYTFGGPPGTTYDLCDVCHWQDDRLQARHPRVRGGANKGSIADYQEEMSQWQVRPANRDPLWRPLGENEAALPGGEKGVNDYSLDYYNGRAPYYWRKGPVEDRPLGSIDDIGRLPSVLRLSEVSSHLVELIEIFRRDGTPAQEGADALLDIISHSGASNSWHSVHVSTIVLDWVAENYRGDDEELVDTLIVIVANLHPQVSRPFFKRRLAAEISDFERQLTLEALEEIQVILEKGELKL